MDNIVVPCFLTHSVYCNRRGRQRSTGSRCRSRGLSSLLTLTTTVSYAKTVESIWWDVD